MSTCNQCNGGLCWVESDESPKALERKDLVSTDTNCPCRPWDEKPQRGNRRCGPRNLTSLRTQKLLCWVRLSDPIGRVHCQRLLSLPAVQILPATDLLSYFFGHDRQLIKKKLTRLLRLQMCPILNFLLENAIRNMVSLMQSDPRL